MNTKKTATISGSVASLIILMILFFWWIGGE